MSVNGVSPTGSNVEWQLVAEFSAGGEPGSENQSVESVLRAARALGLPLTKVAHIHESLMASLEDAKKSAWHGQDLRRCFRIWRLEPVSKQPQSTASEKPHRLKYERNSWGFFLTTRRTPSPVSGECWLMELFFFQEGAGHDR